ncbi:MAG: hypothetical protein OHK0023_11150 [Anaerolineae bacterium]
MDFPQGNELVPDGADRLDDFLMDHADSLILGMPFDHKMEGLDPRQKHELHSLMTLASRLTVLSPVSPDSAFATRLKAELTAPPAPIPSLITRFRQLPPRYRVAASIGGLTLTAGLAFLASRRVWDLVGRLQRRTSADVEAVATSVN